MLGSAQRRRQGLGHRAAFANGNEVEHGQGNGVECFHLPIVVGVRCPCRAVGMVRGQANSADYASITRCSRRQFRPPLERANVRPALVMIQAPESATRRGAPVLKAPGCSRLPKSPRFAAIGA